MCGGDKYTWYIGTWDKVPILTNAGWVEIPRLKEDNNKNTMNNFFKKLTDKKIQTLVKAGYLNSELKITFKGQNALMDLLFLAHYDELVKLADEEIEETEKKK